MELKDLHLDDLIKCLLREHLIKLSTGHTTTDFIYDSEYVREIHGRFNRLEESILNSTKDAFLKEEKLKEEFFKELEDLRILFSKEIDKTIDKYLIEIYDKETIDKYLMEIYDKKLKSKEDKKDIKWTPGRDILLKRIEDAYDRRRLTYDLHGTMISELNPYYILKMFGKKHNIDFDKLSTDELYKLYLFSNFIIGLNSTNITP